MARQNRDWSEWQRLIDEYRRSGLTQAQFAAAHGITAKTLSNWIYRLRLEAKRESLAPAAAFLPVTVRPAVPENPRKGIGPAVGLKIGRSEDTAIEAWFGETFTLRFSPGIDCDYVGRLLASVARQVAC